MKRTAFLFLLVICAASLAMGQTRFVKYRGNPVVGHHMTWPFGATLYLTHPEVIFDGSLYHMWYRAYANTSVIAYAQSTDGLAWVIHPENPAVDLGPPGSIDDDVLIRAKVVRHSTGYLMYYSSVHGQRSVICRALSEDGVIWTKDTVSNPVFVPGAPGEWDDAGVAPGTVLIQGDTLKMWYSGRQANQPERTGYATSTDGVTWTRYPGNPVIEAGSPGSWDDQWQAPPEVLFDGTEYKMWYCGNVSLGYATSADGLSWTKYHNNPILRPEASGWEQGVIYCSAIVESDGVYRYWYSGGSQIGFAVDSPVPFVAQHPTRVDFLPRGVGQVPDTLDVTVMNYGRQSAQVTDVTLQSADF